MNKFINKVVEDKSVFVLINHELIKEYSRGENVFAWNIHNFPEILSEHLDHSIRKISMLNFVKDFLIGADDNSINVSINDSLLGRQFIFDPLTIRRKMLSALTQNIKASSLSNGTLNPNSKIMLFLKELKIHKKLYFLLSGDNILYSVPSSLQEDTFVIPVWSNKELAHDYLGNRDVGAKVIKLEMEFFVSNTLPLLIDSLMLIGFNWDKDGTGPEKYSEEMFELFYFMLNG